jgi:outer membrane scaffolding protein for murein synthesis (MipA/OmpV family)
LAGLERSIRLVLAAGAAGACPVMLLLMGLCWPIPVAAQTPSPLQEWQYSSGVLLRKLFEPNLPTWQVVVGAAASAAPLYDGARPYRVRPGPTVDIRYKDLAFLSAGGGLGVNLLRGENYRAGVALAYDLGRKVSDYPSHLNGLGDISPAPVVKLFASYAVSKSFPLVIRADLRRIVGASDGFVGDLGAYLPLPGSSREFVMFAGPSITFADSNYMQTTFGVDAAQAIASGYKRFKAHAGMKAIGFGFSANWFITDHWLVNGNAAVSRLMTDAADSPITEKRTQGTLALTLAYMF